LGFWPLHASRNAGKTIKGSKDPDFCLVFFFKKETKNYPLLLGP